jgi:hypothetical protein
VRAFPTFLFVLLISGASSAEGKRTGSKVVVVPVEVHQTPGTTPGTVHHSNNEEEAEPLQPQPPHPQAQPGPSSSTSAAPTSSHIGDLPNDEDLDRNGNCP